jgi:DNA replication initiation complex subunit (GINS family)
MKRFNTIVNQQLLKLLEALPQDGGPVIDKDPGAPDEPVRSSPQEKANWEITLLKIAKTAIYNVKNDPESVTPEDEEKLGIDVTPENKEQMLDLLYKLAGKSKEATAPIIEPEEVPAPEQPEAPPEAIPNPLSGGAKPGAAKNKPGQASKPI